MKVQPLLGSLRHHTAESTCCSLWSARSFQEPPPTPLPPLILFILSFDSSVHPNIHLYVLSHFNHIQLFATLWTVALGYSQAALSLDSPGKNTGVGNHSLLQGIFLTHGWNLHCRQILYHLNHQGTQFTPLKICIMCVDYISAIDHTRRNRKNHFLPSWCLQTRENDIKQLTTHWLKLSKFPFIYQHHTKTIELFSHVCWKMKTTEGNEKILNLVLKQN